MKAIVIWFLNVGLAWCAVAVGLRLAGRGWDFAARHMPTLTVAAFLIAVCMVYAGTKPEPPPPAPPSPATNEVRRIPVGIRSDRTITPYGAPIRGKWHE